MFVNITEKPPWGSVIKAITIIITITKLCKSNAKLLKLILKGTVSRYF